jgi:regulatory protein
MRTTKVNDIADTTPRERKTKSAEQALQSLMRLCARAEKSSGDAMRLMRTWGVPEAQRQDVLNKLVELRFIDDKRYAEAYVREKSQLAGWGARKIAMQLRLKGVTKDIVDTTLSTIDIDDQQQHLENKLVKKLRSVKANNSYELRGKLLRYGLGLGYEYDMVVDVIDKIVEHK